MFANDRLFDTVFHWQLPFSFGQVRKKTSSFQFPVFTKHPSNSLRSLVAAAESSSRIGVWPETGLRSRVPPSPWHLAPAPTQAPSHLRSSGDTANVTRHIHYDNVLRLGPAGTRRLNYQTQDWFESLSPKRYASFSLLIIHCGQRTIFMLCPSKENWLDTK